MSLLLLGGLVAADRDLPVWFVAGLAGASWAPRTVSPNGSGLPGGATGVRMLFGIVPTVFVMFTLLAGLVVALRLPAGAHRGPRGRQLDRSAGILLLGWSLRRILRGQPSPAAAHPRSGASRSAASSCAQAGLAGLGMRVERRSSGRASASRPGSARPAAGRDGSTPRARDGPGRPPARSGRARSRCSPDRPDGRARRRAAAAARPLRTIPASSGRRR